MANSDKNIYYHTYEQLDKILTAQEPESAKAGNPAHDEMLFIVVHQAYELWFKQILFELDAVCHLMTGDNLPERNISKATHLLERVHKIQKLMLSQLDVLETMTPLDFMEFRDYVIPASGFQSWQFRMIENRLGMKPERRIQLGDTPYIASLKEPEQKRVQESLNSPSLLELVNGWLSRMPFLNMRGFDFWGEYQSAAESMFKQDEQSIQTNDTLDEERRKRELKRLKTTKDAFMTIFDKSSHENMVKEGRRTFTHSALQASMLIHLYRDEPILHLPHRFLTALMDIDQTFTLWRYRHMLMARRIIGQRIGTGGSSGHDYLREGAEKLKFFPELFEISTFFIPRRSLPSLPQHIQKEMGFVYG